LEEEIAAGIVAAKQVEERFLRHADLQDDAPSEVMIRLRKDAHEVVDVFLDFLVLVTSHLTELSGRLSPSSPPSPSKAKPSPPPEEAAERLRFTNESGNRRRATLKITNRTRKTQSYALSCTDFIDGSARRIPAASLSFEPNQLTLAPNASARVEIRCVLPPSTPGSEYTGLILWGPDTRDQVPGDIRVG
jgi:hypothetical protein